MPTKDEIKQFSQLIEDIDYDLDCGYMEAILKHCSDTGLEIEVASTLISPALKAKIKEEAQNNNMLRKTSKLPI
jgi:hypothetical protein